MARSHSQPDTAETVSESGFRVTAGEIAGVVLLALVLVFVFENTRRVKMRFIYPEVTAPLWVALLASAVVGGLALLLLQRRAHRRQRRS
jgi:uncharacterized integral membrane protein